MPSGARSSRRVAEAPAERYVPGSIIAERYRVSGLLGRGGMGEVYRADDLKLGQPVALKFLPAELVEDPELLSLLLDEVRNARRVAHPNVCRVYDIGEAKGQHFITMEHVDGEDLATLLLRIGRLPGEKATQLARQICAGLAAAHEEGIVHRDLKPANVMVDGRGRARITDFGLARRATAVEGAAARQGTPAYMAPEQLAGREATVRSDVYALGLVLYELFTGRRPFAAHTVAQALDERSSGLPSRPSSHVDDLDPAAERAILSCLDPDPEQRPGSALAVAAAFPGGDPLAAALAVGETPSPELVAAAPTEAGIRPGIAVAGVVFCLAAILAGQWMEHRLLVAPGGKPPVVLADRAAELLARLGYPTEGHDTAWGYGRPATPSARPLFDPATAEAMTTGASPPYYTFWYRRAPGALMPVGRLATSPDDPPRSSPSSALVELDTGARLVGLEIWPPPGPPEEGVGERSPAAAADWGAVLEMAGLARGDLERIESSGAPPMHATEVAAWRGTYPAGMERRVEAAARDGRVVWFRVFDPARGDPGLVLEALPETFLVLLYLLFLLILVAGLWLARANLLSGRGDRRGAWRVALVVGGCWLVGLALGATHAPAVAEFLLWYKLLGHALFVGTLTGVFYLGLEPLLRRNWPHRIVGWARALAGRFGDPLVGQGLFAGAVVTAAAVHLAAIGFLAGQAAGSDPAVWSVLIPEGTGWQAARVLSLWPISVGLGVLQGLGFAVLTLVVIRAVRSEPLGALLVAGVMTFGLAMRDQVTDPGLLLGVLAQCLLITWLLLRHGLLAYATAIVLTNMVVMYPTTRFGGSWLATGSTALALTVPLVAAYGAWASSRSTRRPGARG
jgi:serine/threonine-protein kinase